MSVIQQFRSGYSKRAFLKDLIAALSVVILLIPQGLAYGLLAGFPAESGLYTGVVALFVYPLFASSRYLSVGPVALASIILLSGLSGFAVPGTEEYVRLGVIVCAMAGVIQVLFGVFRLGILVNFLSNPVISGFISATAIVIIINQLNVLLGIPLERTNNAFIDLKNTILASGNINLAAASLGLGSIAIIYLIKSFSKKIPSSLIVFIVCTVLTYFLVLSGFSIDRIGDFPGGFPLPKMLNFSGQELLNLLPLSLVIALMSFIDSSVLGKSMAIKAQNHRINSNHELFGLGISKIIGSFLMNVPSSGSFARSEINRASPSETQFSSWIAALILLLAILFFTPLFSYTPKAMLAAVIITSVIKLVNITEMRRLFKLDRPDFFALVSCFIITITVGIQAGIFSGILISIGFILWKSMRPHYAVLGKIEKHNVYRNINRFDNATYDDSTMIFRFDEDIYFANSEFFYDKVMHEIDSRPDMKILIIDLSSVSYIDSTGFDTLRLLSKNIKTRTIEWKFSRMKGPVRDLFDEYGYEGIIDQAQCYMSITLAVKSCE